VCATRDASPSIFSAYTFGPMYSPRTGGRYNGVRPSKRAVASIKENIRRQLRPGNQAPWEEIARDLNRADRRRREQKRSIKSGTKLAVRQGFEPWIQVLARITV
jgi:hypothetical protein